MYAYRQNVQNTERVGVLPICGGSNKFQAKADRQRRTFAWNVRSRIPYISSTPTFLYFDLYFNTAYTQHTMFIESWKHTYSELLTAVNSVVLHVANYILSNVVQPMLMAR